jgi:hypothetical protein
VSRIPIAFTATYVGQRPGGTFKNSAGEEIPYPPKLKFLHQGEDGDASLVEISGNQIDKVTPPFNWADLEGGEVCRIAGVAVIQERGSERDSYVQITAFATA